MNKLLTVCFLIASACMVFVLVMQYLECKAYFII